MSPHSRDTLSLTATPGFKALSSLRCIHTHSNCSINPHLFPCGFSIFKDSPAARASVSPHQASVQIREKALLPPGRHSPARLRGSVEHGWTSAPQLAVLCSEPPASRGSGPSRGQQPDLRRLGPPPLSILTGTACLGKAGIRGFPAYFPALSLSKPNNNRKCPPLRVPQYSRTEVYTTGRALGGPLQ